MRHFHRTTLAPTAVLTLADGFFVSLGMEKGGGDALHRQADPRHLIDAAY